MWIQSWWFLAPRFPQDKFLSITCSVQPSTVQLPLISSLISTTSPLQLPASPLFKHGTCQNSLPRIPLTSLLCPKTSIHPAKFSLRVSSGQACWVIPALWEVKEELLEAWVWDQCGQRRGRLCLYKKIQILIFLFFSKEVSSYSGYILLFLTCFLCILILFIYALIYFYSVTLRYFCMVFQIPLRDMFLPLI